MDYFENHCYWFIRLILLYTGLWPYTDKRTRFISATVQIFIVTIVMLTVVKFQLKSLLKFVTLFPNIESVIYILGYLSIVLVAFLSYFFLNYKMSQVKELWEHVESDWKKLEKINKISIMERYAYKSNLLSLYVIILISIYYVFTCLDVFLPYILEAMVPMKEPDRFKIIISVEFFGKYELPLTLLLIILLTEIGILMAIYLSEFIVFVHHACLLFSLAGDVLEQGFANIKDLNNAIDKDKILYETIVESAKCHGTAIRFTKMLEDMYNFACFYIMIAVIAMLASNTLRFFYMIMARDLFPTIASFFFLFCTVGVAFIVTHVGQLLINHSLDVFNKACAIPWYMASLKTQKLLLLILIRGMKESCITHGKMAILAHTLFTTMLHSGISFATVFINMR